MSALHYAAEMKFEATIVNHQSYYIGSIRSGPMIQVEY